MIWWWKLGRHSHHARSKQVLLHVPCNRDLTCDVDPVAIRQVLSQAFDNAISTGVEKPKIEVGYVEDEVEGLPAITIIVSDNGPGSASRST